MVRMVLCFAALGVSVAAADPHPMNAGAHVGPRAQTQVAIARETLTVAVGWKFADVRAELELTNPGEATTLLVGFPCERKAPDGVATLTCDTKLDVTIAGKRVKPRLRKTEITWTMTFPAGATVPLVVAYRSKFVNERYEVPLDGASHVLYRLKTGAEWAGPIGKLDIKVTVPGDGIADITPAGYTRQPGVIEWHLTDYEPAEDLVLYFPPRIFTHWIGLMEKRAKAPDKAAVDRQLDELLKEMTEDVDQYLEFAKLLERLFKIPAPPRQRLVDTLARSRELMQGARK